MRRWRDCWLKLIFRPAATLCLCWAIWSTAAGNHWKPSSWCIPCAAEAPQLMALKQAGVAIDAIAIRDARPDVDAFLARNGTPYSRIGLDARSGVQIALGSSGVPETFVIDGNGTVILRHAGPITANILEERIRPALAQAAGE
jgi:DsbE subfamily thiol:disulfide oxidoreductase